MGARFRRKDGRGQEVSAGKCGFTDLPVQLLGRFCIQNRFVGCAQSRERARDIRLQRRQLRSATFAGPWRIYAYGTPKWALLEGVIPDCVGTDSRSLRRGGGYFWCAVLFWGGAMERWRWRS